MMSKTESIIISTGLRDNTSKNVLLNVIGQLSDGMWENSRAMTHYWPFADIEMVDGKVCIVISKKDTSYNWTNGGYGYNYFVSPMKMNGDRDKIKKFFAEKIHAIIRQEAKDYPNRGIKFSDKCDVPLNYIFNHDDYSQNITVSDAYAVYETLLDRR